MSAQLIYTYDGKRNHIGIRTPQNDNPSYQWAPICGEKVNGKREIYDYGWFTVRGLRPSFGRTRTLCIRCVKAAVALADFAAAAASTEER